ncbi:MAG TPA: SulP family inorganic anion transporter, partial [Candidatus Bathyarchaeia archaeon]|nr:SulP family inorganic anion transporter [Candidatus Bathyarchaeia archaeon]
MSRRKIQDYFFDKSTKELKSSKFPLLQGILPVIRSQVPLDIIAGLTLAALAIPEVMGYARIAGTPVITGLYTLVVPLALFACLGSSRHLVVGADSATAAVLASGLIGIAAIGSPEYLAYASLLALMAAALLIVARLAKLGFLADFLSRTVLVGFLTGVGFQVAVAEIPGILGLPGRVGNLDNPIQGFVRDVLQISQTNLYTLAISIGVISIILGAGRISKKMPGPLIAVIGAIVVSSVFNLSSHGVSVLGSIPSGLPVIGLPRISLSLSLIEGLLPIAFSMFIIILTQSAATSQAYATRYNEHFDENLDLIGLGMANLGAALSGTFVVNGSPTKTQMVDSAGSRSQLAQLTTVAVVVAVLLFLTGPLTYLPTAVLAAVVFLIGKQLIDVKGMRQIFIERPAEFWVALITAGVVFFVGVEQGILIAILLSLVAHTRHGYRPKNDVLLMDAAGNRSPVPITTHAQLLP